MTEHYTGPRSNLIEFVDSFAMDNDGLYIETHPRFNLVPVNDNALDVVVTSMESGERERMIITNETEKTSELYKQLSQGGVLQFERQDYESGVSIYRLPGQAKPLGYERLFLDRHSSDTYVSDQEIFMYFGKLWADIYRQTRHLPADKFLRHTALLDFEAPERSLIPVPPYQGWIEIYDLQGAGRHLFEKVKEELQNTGSYTMMKPISDAIVHGWREDGAA